MLRFPVLLISLILFGFTETAVARPRGHAHGYRKHHVHRSYPYHVHPYRMVHRHYSGCGHVTYRPYHQTNVYYYDDPSWAIGLDSNGSVDVHVGW